MGADASQTIRREVLFQGRVQGVGFRYTARQIASRFRVAGFVQNLPDGRVLLEVQGALDEVERFIQAILSEMAGYVTGHGQRDIPTGDEQSGFEVRR